MNLQTLIEKPEEFQERRKGAITQITLRLLEDNEHERKEEDFSIVGILLFFFGTGETITVEHFMEASVVCWTEIEKAEQQWGLGPDAEEAEKLATRLVETCLPTLFPFYIFPFVLPRKGRTVSLLLGHPSAILSQ